MEGRILRVREFLGYAGICMSDREAPQVVPRLDVFVGASMTPWMALLPTFELVVDVRSGYLSRRLANQEIPFCESPNKLSTYTNHSHNHSPLYTQSQ